MLNLFSLNFLTKFRSAVTAIGILAIHSLAASGPWDYAKQQFSDGWLFRRDAGKIAQFPETPDRHWTHVSIPHEMDLSEDYEIPSQVGSVPNVSADSVAWFRRHVSLPQETAGKMILLVIRGDLSGSHLWVNGHDFPAPTDGRDEHKYDISHRFKSGSQHDNVIVIRHQLDAGKLTRFPGPDSSDGIWLRVRNPVHLVGGKYRVQGPVIDAASTRIKIWGEVTNEREMDAEVVVRHQLFAPSGLLVGQSEFAVEVRAGQSAPVANDLVFNSIPTDGAPEASAYRVTTTLLEFNEWVDGIESTRNAEVKLGILPPIDRGAITAN